MKLITIILFISCLVNTCTYGQDESLKTYYGHKGAVNSVAVSPDGQFYLSGSSDGTAKLWDVGSDECIRAFNDNKGEVRSVSFSTDSKRLCAYSDSSICVWDVNSKKTYFNVFKYDIVKNKNEACFLDKKQIIVTAINGGLEVYEERPLSTQQFMMYGHKYFCLALSKDRKVMSAGRANGSITLFDLNTREVINTLTGGSAIVSSVTFGRNKHTLISGSYDSAIRIWGTDEGKWIRTLKGHTGRVMSVAISPDGKYIISASDDKSIKLWDAKTYKCLRTYKGHSGSVNSVAFCSDSKHFISGSNDNTLKLWSVSFPEEKHYIPANEQPIPVKHQENKGLLIDPPIEESTEIRSTGKYYALFFAEKDYELPIQSLQYPISDARSLADCLQDKYVFDSVNIINNVEKATIIATIYAYRKMLSADDHLLILYSGHGLWDHDAKQGYWLPVNAKREDPVNWVSNGDIRDQLNGMKCRHVLLISDACFAGSILNTRNVDISDAPKSIADLYKTKSRRAMTSGAMTETPDKSSFIYYMISALNANKEKYISSEKLFSQFKDNAMNNSPLHTIPQFGVIRETDDQGGDFIFIRK